MKKIILLLMLFAVNANTATIFEDCSWQGSDELNTGGPGGVWNSHYNYAERDLRKCVVDKIGFGATDSCLQYDGYATVQEYLQCNFDMILTAGIRFAFQIRKEQLADNNEIRIAQILCRYDGVAGFLNIVQESGNLKLKLYSVNGGTNIIGTSSNLSMNTWYQVSLLFRQNTAGGMSAKLYDEMGTQIGTEIIDVGVTSQYEGCVGVQLGSIYYENIDRNILFDRFTIVDDGYAPQIVLAETPPTISNPKLLFIGDSKTSGANVSSAAGYRYPLQNTVGIPKYEIVGPYIGGANPVTKSKRHAGYGGYTTAQTLSSIKTTLSTSLPTPTPANTTILLDIGSSDCDQQLGSGTLDEKTQSYVDNIDDIVDSIFNYDNNIRIIVAQICPSTTAETNNFIVSFNANLADWYNTKKLTVPKLKLVDMYTSFVNHTGWQTDYMGDYINPNDAGYAVEAGVWAAAMTLGKTPASITQQPTDQIVNENSTATFSVTATGNNLTYQWYRNNELQIGETSSSYSFTATIGLDRTTVYCELTTDTTISTDTVSLTVTPVSTHKKYVSTTGNNTNDGSYAHPWRDIAFALCGGAYGCPCATTNNNLIVAGDTLLIRGGTYHEHGIEIASNATRDNKITIKSFPGEMATIDGDSAQETFIIGDHNSNNYITFDSLTVRNGQETNFFIGNNYPDTAIVWKNCTIENAIPPIPSNGTTSAMGWVKGNGVNDTIFNCVIKGSARSSCLHFMDVNSVAIINCDISGGSYGVYFKHYNKSNAQCIVKNNFIHDCWHEGIATNSNNIHIENNLVIGNSEEDGIQLWCLGLGGGGGYCKVEHNTVYLTNTAAIGVRLGWGSSTDTIFNQHLNGAMHDTIVNNVIYVNNNSIPYYLWHYAPDSAFVNTPNQYDSSNYNCYYSNGGYPIARQNTAYNFTAWTALYPNYDNNSVFANPQFVNISGNLDTITDFALTSASPGYHAASDGTDMGCDISKVGAGLNLPAGNPPVITTQPHDSTVAENSQVSFSVAATNATGYQWYGNNTLIPGATGTTYSFTATHTLDGTTIFCIVSNADGSVSSDTATLTVTDISLTKEPDSIIIKIRYDELYAGQQWYEHDTAITGATSLRCVIVADSAAYANKNYYYCKVWNSVNDTVQSGTWHLGLQQVGTKQKRWFGFKAGAFIGAWR